MRCKDVALPVANIQRSFANIYKFQDKYISSTSFSSLSFTERLTALFEGYLVFWDFAVNMDDLVQNETIALLWTQMNGTFGTEFVGALRNNLISNTFSVSQLFISLNGSDCRQSGVRFGALLRKTMSYELYD